MLQSESYGITCRECPNCREIFTNDKTELLVACLFCKANFCFGCSAPKDPIMAHGSSYHRKCCKFYRFYECYDVKYSEKCSECKK